MNIIEMNDEQELLLSWLSGVAQADLGKRTFVSLFKLIENIENDDFTEITSTLNLDGVVYTFNMGLTKKI